MEWVAFDEGDAELSSLLLDMERTLDQIALAVPGHSLEPAQAEGAPGEKLSLFLPDAFGNPEYVRFAVKGSLAALICYILFIGFDYPGIYTSVITCFVVSLSTIGASNQKGILRFGGAAVGGVMGLVALVYLFPNVDTIGGFWLVFGAGTAVAAWVNFGTPRISYGGYQTGLAFYKATLQGFGPAISATVVRDRLIGVLLGLIVFGAVEHLLWPVRAVDRMRERLADVLRSLAGLALVCTGTETAGANDVDGRRRLISQQVADVQGLVESSKFEPGGAGPEEIERLTGDAQSVFLVLLVISRDETGRAALSDGVRETARQLDTHVARVLTAVAELIQNPGAASLINADKAMGDVERSLSAFTEQSETHNEARRTRLALYREMVAAVNRLSLDTRGLSQA
jgi:multidrug resistance protein MdtO